VLKLTSVPNAASVSLSLCFWSLFSNCGWKKGEILSDLIRGRENYERFGVSTAVTIDLPWAVTLYNRYVEFKSIIRCQIVHLVDRSDLFTHLLHGAESFLRS